MLKNRFKPSHINTTHKEMEGNDKIGRYVFLPNTDTTANEIAAHFTNVKIKSHESGHHLYLGLLNCAGKKYEVATIATGFGCPSTEIILHELFHLGAKRFLRIGNAYALQPNIPADHLINVQAAVRDEGTTKHYAPIEVPAVASLEFITATLLAASQLGVADSLHTGIVHCNNALYARKRDAGLNEAENKNYLNQLIALGVLASEMETATLFIQSQFYNHQLSELGEAPENHVLAGAILGITNSPEESTHNKNTLQNTIQLAIETMKTLAVQEVID